LTFVAPAKWRDTPLAEQTPHHSYFKFTTLFGKAKSATNGVLADGWGGSLDRIKRLRP
jgi:hypothetical protein